MYRLRNSVENLHAQLKLTGNFEPEGKHPRALVLSIAALDNKVVTLFRMSRLFT